ncbi:hypothetical protein FB567DRAFT_516565 [Paraphoma chrysanthemicola]|uniref:Hemerythrin-like domain-containing protein n=1 Tax=Paraphoma chrysanthemicola TaxID=798071 RepID=A0A8K0W2F7_9PLEO|nr:hypothetical protein FB567DRAFT_516565 [Paraphoma chrysanthemicola]
MPSIRFYTLSILQAAILAYILYRPSTMTQADISNADKLWFDEPCALVTTPQFASKRSDIFTIGATHMAHIHNAIFRGYNSIYQQAPYVQEADKAAFIGYALTWYRFVKSHHDDEEAELFPKVEEILGESGKDIWDETHEEHKSFLPGLAEYEKYLSSLPTPQDFNGTRLRAIMSNFQNPFTHHFHHEITTIASLSTHPAAPPPDSPESAHAASIFKTWGKKTVTKAGTFDVVPFFLLNLDTEYEDGMWANWPPMPGPVKWGLVNVAGAVHWGWWKFASCGADGRRRVLYARDDGTGKDAVDGESEGLPH